MARLSIGWKRSATKITAVEPELLRWHTERLIPAKLMQIGPLYVKSHFGSRVANRQSHDLCGVGDLLQCLRRIGQSLGRPLQGRLRLVLFIQHHV